MDESTTKEKILKRIRNALIYKTENIYSDIDFNSSVFSFNSDAPDIVFAQEFTKLGGQFVYCENEAEFISLFKDFCQQLKWNNLFCKEEDIIFLLEKTGIKFSTDDNDFINCHIGITSCEQLISRVGSIMFSSRQGSGRKLLVFPEKHVVVAYSSQVVEDIQDALVNVKERYQGCIPSLITMVAGPSRTADIEKTLVMGAHGPKELYVFFIDDLLNNEND